VRLHVAAMPAATAATRPVPPAAPSPKIGESVHAPGEGVRGVRACRSVFSDAGWSRSSHAAVEASHRRSRPLDSSEREAVRATWSSTRGTVGLSIGQTDLLDSRVSGGSCLSELRGRRSEHWQAPQPDACSSAPDICHQTGCGIHLQSTLATHESKDEQTIFTPTDVLDNISVDSPDGSTRGVNAHEAELMESNHVTAFSR